MCHKKFELHQSGLGKSGDLHDVVQVRRVTLVQTWCAAVLCVLHSGLRG